MTRRRSSAPEVPTTSRITSTPGRWLPNLAAGVSVWNLAPDLNAPQLFDGRLLEPVVDGPESLPDRVEWDVTGLLPLAEARAAHPEKVERAARQFAEALERADRLFTEDGSFARYRAAFTVPRLGGDGERHYFFSPETGKLYVMNWGASPADAGTTADQVVDRLGFSERAGLAAQAPAAGPRPHEPAPLPAIAAETARERRRSLRRRWLVGAAALLAVGAALVAVQRGESEPDSAPSARGAQLPSLSPPSSSSPPRAVTAPTAPKSAAPPPLPEALQRVHFEVDNAELVSAHLDVLEQLRRHLEAHPAVRLLIEGHSDPRGVDGGNMVLSMMRATRVRSWLVEHGVEPGRLRALGCGARHPLERAQTPAAMRANRRVELRVLVPPSEVEPHPREGCIDAPPRLGERAGAR